MRDTINNPADDPVFTLEDKPKPDYRLREMEARLDRRLGALESRSGQVGWGLRILGAAFFASLVAVVVLVWRAVPGDGNWSVQSVSTAEVVLRDADGIERGRLFTDADGTTRFALADQDGRDRLQFTVLADGSPGVTLHDENERPRAVLGYLPDGTTNLVLADQDGTGRAMLGVEADGSARAFFADQRGEIRALVGVGADGEPSVSTFDIEAGGDETDEGNEP